MRKLILALVLTLAACLALAAAASADPGPIQVSGQDATTQQQSGAASSATQVDPSNSNISIRVLSPGNDGDVTQSNTASSSAMSGNQAGTTQTAGQTAGGSGIQTSQQQAGTDQLSAALSAAAQAGASNANLPVRVLSPGNDGSVTQSNGVDSQATSGNAATTGQTSTQSDGGSCGCGSGGIQTGKQDAGTEQSSGAASDAKQIDPSNTNVSIRVLSPGNGGDVSQSNSATSNAMSGNTATTTQNATQSQDGKGGCGCSTPTAPASACGCASAADPQTAVATPATPVGTSQSNTDGSTATSGNEAGAGQTSQQSGSGTGIQTGYQSAGTEQSSGALSDAKQIDPSNTAGSVRVLSPGNDGDVTQSNSVSSKATSGNKATTTQTANQAQDGGSCGCGTGAIQVAGQDAWTGQESLAGSAAAQFGASNDASPVRVFSPGNGGDVSQSNDVSSTATSGNAATTSQTGNQLAGGSGCGCGGGAIQVLGQQSKTDQQSAALSAAIQAFGGGRSECGCGGSASGNDASPVRVWSPGNDGDVTQSNSDTSTATSGNTAGTTQKGWQGAGGNAIQVAGQEADTGQGSLAASLAAQLGAANKASPVRVYSPGNGGSVSQDNTAGSTATSGNGAWTGQSVGQSADGSPCGCSRPIQVSGQKADSDQLSKALSAAFQIAAANGSDPTWVKSYGNDGSAAQDNTSSSLGTSGNRAGTAGEAMQQS